MNTSKVQINVDKQHVAYNVNQLLEIRFDSVA